MSTNLIFEERNQSEREQVRAWLRPSLTPSWSTVALLGVLVAVALVYLPTLDLYFHGDDFVGFVEMVSLEQEKHLWQVFTFQDSNFYWRPLGECWNLLIYSLAGLNSAAFHAANLAVFLVTIVFVYLFCVNFRLPRVVALTACLFFGLFPAHVISVAWVTNGSRLLATAFFMAALLLVQRGLISKRLRFEVGAWLSLLAAGMCDETVLALAPVLVFYPVAFSPARFGRRDLVRGLAMFTICAVLIPLQFIFTLDDEPRLSEYGPGDHMGLQFWALTSRLALPIDREGLMATPFRTVPEAEWIAGAVVIVVLGFLLLVGSWQLRFLIAWLILGLLPFTFFDIPGFSSRYVYYAAVPYSAMVTWICYEALSVVKMKARPLQALRPLAMGLSAGILTVVFAQSVIARHRAWNDETSGYRTLAEELPQALPTVPEDGRVILFYDDWRGWDLWPKSVVRTVYEDPDLDVVIFRDIPEVKLPVAREDIVISYAEGHFQMGAGRSSR